MNEQEQPAVLVVDDEPLNLSVVATLMQGAGYQVLTAQDGPDGIIIAREARPALILLDVMMPGMDGFAVCRKLKEDASLASIPVIFLTALNDSRNKIRGFEVGGVDYICKPIKDQEVLARVGTHIRLSQMQEQLVAQNRRLQESEQQFRAIFDGVGVGIALLDPAGGFRRCNGAMGRLFGYADDQWAQLDITRLDVIEEEDNTADLINAFAEGRDEPASRIKRMRRRDGVEFWVEQGLTPLLDDKGRCHAVISAITDLTEYKRAQEETRLSTTVYETAAEGIMVTDAQNHILSVNPAFCRMTGYSREEIVGKSPCTLSSGKHDEAFYQALWNDIVATGRWQGEVWNRRKNGELYPQHLAISVVRDQDGEIVNHVAIGVDITRQKELEELLRKQAHFDPLTHLPNRALFTDRLRLALHRAQRHREMVAVFYVDLDGFKPVNDALGHEEGDRVLQHMAACLNDSVREEDTVARLGGDEFAVILADLQSEQDAVEVADRVLQQAEFTVDGAERQFTVSLSIGIAFYPGDARDQKELVNHADQAMYKAKRSGKARWSMVRDLRA